MENCTSPHIDLQTFLLLMKFCDFFFFFCKFSSDLHNGTMLSVSMVVKVSFVHLDSCVIPFWFLKYRVVVSKRESYTTCFIEAARGLAWRTFFRWTFYTLVEFSDAELSSCVNQHFYERLFTACHVRTPGWWVFPAKTQAKMGRRWAPRPRAWVAELCPQTCLYCAHSGHLQPP